MANPIKPAEGSGAEVFELQGSIQSEHHQLVAEGEHATSKERQPSMSWMLLRELAETILLAVIIFFLIRQVVQNYRIESLSMEPNFSEGEFILVNKLAYRLGEPIRGDVIVFHNPSNPSEDYIKRIIALPGDTVEIRDQAIYINNRVLEEPYEHNRLAPASRFGPLIVEPNHLFVMGDNRPNSKDSREFGALSENLIVGRAWLQVWPIAEFGLVQHYELEPGVSTVGDN
jgi:signal peptidase I